MRATQGEDRVGRIHLAVVAYTDYQGDARVRREAEAIASAGHDVEVIALRGRGSAPPVGTAGVRLWQLPLHSRRGGRLRYFFQYLMFFAMSTFRLFSLHLRSRIDVVHVHSLPDFQVFCGLPLKLWGVTLVLDLHEAFPEILAARFPAKRTSLLVKWARFSERVSCKFADQVIVANDGIKTAVVSRGTTASKLTTIYNTAPDLSELESNHAVRDALGLPDGRLIVHAGGVNPERDLETLIRAVASIPRHPDFTLVIAGEADPVYLSSLRALASSVGVSNRVFLLPRLPQSRALSLMALSEVGVVTARSNPLTELAWPSRIAEFAHLRKPLIVAHLGFVSRTLGGAAAYYVPGDPTSLAQRIMEVTDRAKDNQETVERALDICRRLEGGNLQERLLRIYLGRVNSGQAKGANTNSASAAKNG